MVVGHTACSDELWRAAAELGRSYDTGLNFHMSPAATDPEHFLAQFGRRPIEHLAELGVLGPNTVITQCVHVDDHETKLLAQPQCRYPHSPTPPSKGSYAHSKE